MPFGMWVGFLLFRLQKFGWLKLMAVTGPFITVPFGVQLRQGYDIHGIDNSFLL